tara:strand:- start:199 stop:588 length:390 start_codon:yes stop_codon:yes gene_type:complete
MIVFGSLVSGQDAVKGLMYVKKPLNSRYGMLFDMGYKVNSMWMKNTFIPLDVIFLDKNMNIIGYKENNKPHSLKSISISKPSKYVLEMNSGTVKNFNLKHGDKIYFLNIKFIYILIFLIFILILLKYNK